MERKIGILAFALAIAMCFLTIGALAVSENSSSQIPFVESEDIFPENPEEYTEETFRDFFETVFGEKGEIIFAVAMIGVFIMPLFIPCLIIVIVLAVLNGKAKKKIKEYEICFGSVPQNNPAYYNPSNNMAYGAQPVYTPYNAPAQSNYAPQNNENSQQGGQL